MLLEPVSQISLSTHNTYESALLESKKLETEDRETEISLENGKYVVSELKYE